jgi:hypothetical protein
MIPRPLVFLVLVLALGGAPARPTQAHHGPPHDEIDEFDTPAARLAVPVPAGGVSWPAAVLSMVALGAVWAASRKWGVDAPTPSPVLVRRSR